jgi:hypothetical protein
MTESLLRAEAQAMSDQQLADALDWQRALADHADENFRAGDYTSAMHKVEIIKAEQARRKAALCRQ